MIFFIVSHRVGFSQFSLSQCVTKENKIIFRNESYALS